MIVEHPERRLLAVLGSPIAHSKSPAIHAAAYRELGLDWEYRRVEVRDGGLAGFVTTLGPEWRGLSLTMPLKREARGVASVCDALVADLDQANTLLLGDGIRAYSTDVDGVSCALGAAGIGRIERATILGAGATAESAVVALRRLGAEVVVAARSPERAGRVAALASVVPFAAAPLDAEVTVSTVPGGSAVPKLPGRIRGLLLDVAYDPWPTPLAAAWTAAGGSVVSGLEMLLHQALVQVRIFVLGDPGGRLPDEERVFRAMRAAVEDS